MQGNIQSDVGEGLCSSRVSCGETILLSRSCHAASICKKEAGMCRNGRSRAPPLQRFSYLSDMYPWGPGPQPRSFSGVRGFQRGEGDRRRARPVGEEASRSVGTAKKPAGDYCGSRMDRNPPRPFGLSGARSPAHSAGSYLLSKDQSSIFNLQSAAGGDLIRHILRRATLPKGEGLVVYHGRDRKKPSPFGEGKYSFSGSG